MKPAVLLIDDSATLRAAVDEVLSEAGYQVHTAINGREGLDLLARWEGDQPMVGLIITDINMPVMDGLEFIRTVKQTRDRFIPVIVLTTESEMGKKQAGRLAGAAGWLVKPFHPETLVQVVRKFVR